MHPRVVSSPEHVPLFRLLGRLLGLSLARGLPLPVRLSRLFYKLMFTPEEDGPCMTLEDLRFVDPQGCVQLTGLLGSPLADGGLKFVDEVVEAGTTVPLPLLPGGGALAVNEANKAVYVALKAVARITRATDSAMRAALRSGVLDFVPQALLDPALFDAAELQELIEGSA